jgi:uncharacterized peroxidase-related enzyme
MGGEESDRYVHEVARSWREAPLSQEDRALCEFAHKLTHHQGDMDGQDVERLREFGFEDRAIHDAVQVIGYFNYITRVAEALGVEEEDFIQEWGRG